MKKSILLSATALVLMLGACNSSSTKNEQSNSTDSTAVESTSTAQTFNLDTTTLASGATFYQCSMHAEVLSDKQGSCPQCGMDLSEMKKRVVQLARGNWQKASNKFLKNGRKTNFIFTAQSNGCIAHCLLHVGLGYL